MKIIITNETANEIYVQTVMEDVLRKNLYASTNVIVSSPDAAPTLPEFTEGESVTVSVQDDDGTAYPLSESYNVLRDASRTLRSVPEGVEVSISLCVGYEGGAE